VVSHNIFVYHLPFRNTFTISNFQWLHLHIFIHTVHFLVCVASLIPGCVSIPCISFQYIGNFVSYSMMYTCKIFINFNNKLFANFHLASQGFILKLAENVRMNFIPMTRFLDNGSGASKLIHQGTIVLCYILCFLNFISNLY
jgi:hypothetical protein